MAATRHLPPARLNDGLEPICQKSRRVANESLRDKSSHLTPTRRVWQSRLATAGIAHRTTILRATCRTGERIVQRTQLRQVPRQARATKLCLTTYVEIRANWLAPRIAGRARSPDSPRRQPSWLCRPVPGKRQAASRMLGALVLPGCRVRSASCREPGRAERDKPRGVPDYRRERA
jgi:hypothetical protein